MDHQAAGRWRYFSSVDELNIMSSYNKSSDYEDYEPVFYSAGKISQSNIKITTLGLSFHNGVCWTLQESICYVLHLFYFIQYIFFIPLECML